MAKCLTCKECPFFEFFLKEFEESVGMEVGKGHCHKFHADEIWETKASCPYAENRSIEELKAEAFQ